MLGCLPLAVALIVDDLGDKPCVLQTLCNAFNSGFTKVTKILRVEHVAVIACATAVDNFMTVPEAHCYDIASIDPKVGEAFLESVIYPMLPAGAKAALDAYEGSIRRLLTNRRVAASFATHCHEFAAMSKRGGLEWGSIVEHLASSALLDYRSLSGLYMLKRMFSAGRTP